MALISQNTLVDGCGEPKSSLNKAYESLLDNYDVFFVCPVPTNHPSTITEQQAWIEDAPSTLAWNHTILTNQPHLLYGGYFINSTEHDGFLGINLLFGSEELETWEETITFFERLGGQ